METETPAKHEPSLKLFLAGLMISLLVGALDTSIITTAMPKIISNLGGMAYYVWPFTIYLLTSTISIIASGKLSDIFGRRKVLLAGIGIFVASSILCGFSQNMLELTLFRGLQGLGGGAIITTPFIVVAEVFPARDRGKYTGILSSVFGFASVLGPLLGGLVTDLLGWRWVFFINIPIGIVAVYMLMSYFPNLEEVVKEANIDYKGIVSLTVCLSSLFIALTFMQNGSISWLVVAFITFSVLMLGVFLHSEKNAKEPVLPLHLFKNSVFNISSIEMFLSNAVMYCGTVYIPLFMEDVKGFSASSSGIFLTSMLVSLTLASIITGQLISRTGTYKKFAVLGFSLLAASMLLFSSVGTGTWIGTVVMYAALLGLGSGMMYPIFNAAAQNAVSKRELGVVTASMQFFRNIGSTVALPIFGVIVNLTVNINASTGSVAPSLMSSGIHNVFLSGLIISVVGLGICFLLEDVFLSSRLESGDSEKRVTGK